ncbi:MAG: heliorhodopsin HeR [Microthrixaceae bacterium]
MITDDPSARLKNLRVWNIGVGLFMAVQAVAILLLSKDFSIPVVATVQTGPPGAAGSLSQTTTFFNFSFPIAIVMFLVLAAADHLLVSSPKIRPWYEANLGKGINYARWIEYSISASLMILLISLLFGINNLYALIAIFGVNASMILFGLLMEQVNQDRSNVNWLPFIFGCLAGIIPWAILVISVVVSSTESTSGNQIPTFVYVIFVTEFLLFNCFAINQWLQYRSKGKFADYLYGEKVYLVLSLVAKSALAWQVFGGTLAS